jgi:sigma-B regulation protein RsbU (phosphoserine phosphatase)
MFVTFFCAILNIRTGQVDYSNGGHNLPYYLHHSGVSPLENPGGRALGVVEQSAYISGRMVLSPGEALLLYTDGVTEAENSQGEEYGMERLSTLIRRGSSLSADGLMNHILESVTEFSKDVGFSDDATLLVLKFNFD